MFKRRNNSSSNKIDHFNNSNNNISESIFAGINKSPDNNITSEPINFITCQIFESNNNHAVFGQITGDGTTTTTTINNSNNHEVNVSGNISEVEGYSIVTMEIISLSKCRNGVNAINIKKKVLVFSTIEEIR